MSHRTNIITVVLEKNFRVDDAEPILAAIRQIRGVISASANVSTPTEWMAEERARYTLGSKIIEVIYPKAK